MKCRFCGHDNPSGEKYCASCGTPIVYPLGEDVSDEKERPTKEDTSDRGADKAVEKNEGDAAKIEPEDVSEIPFESNVTAESSASEGEAQGFDAKKEAGKIEPEDVSEIPPEPVSASRAVKENKDAGRELARDDEDAFKSSKSDDPRKRQSDKRKRKKLKKQREREAKEAGIVPEEAEESKEKPSRRAADASDAIGDKKEQARPADEAKEPEEKAIGRDAGNVKLSDTVRHGEEEKKDDSSKAPKKEGELKSEKTSFGAKEPVESPKHEKSGSVGDDKKEKRSSHVAAIVVIALIIVFVFYKALK
ncbi:MAG: hypothetical protein SPI65_04280 [Peptoniphilus sp.]|nr:hypothetical protein [Peptoniphilus sp.]MDD7363515.1 hypothetical protein [Bacillota bacterium]MDY6044782.1 hypothetical protein [Peptoniphilus sp.]